MEVKAFKGANKEELSMIEVAHAILEEHGDVMDFSDLVNKIQNYLNKADKDIREILPQFYTDLNIDGSFISLGENRWGLRSWYPFESIDEEVSQTGDEDEDTPRRKKRKKVNAFLDSNDDDVIDYNDDDPEDTDLDDDDDDDYDDDEEDETVEIAAYNSDLSEIGANDITDDEEEIPEGVEEDLTIIDDTDTDLDEFDDESEDE